MSAAPQISVIMPVYNGAAVIARALTTAFAQTLADYEVIVVDDGSTDGLEAALRPFGAPSLRLLRQARNRGAAAARNAGIRAARADYIAFLDCDDEWLPEKLARQYAALHACPPEIMVSITGYYLVRDRFARREIRPLPPERDWYWRLLGGCNLNVGSGLMVRKRAFEDVGYYAEDMRRLEDWDWLLRYAAKYTIATVEDPLAVYHSGLTWPSAETVAGACQQIWDRHGAVAAARSPAAARLLRSTIVYERAAALYHQRQPFGALLAAAESALIYPPRGLGFYRHLLYRGKDLLRWRFG
jgi:glycosyltransferase involved in cell wall biosynthesis